MPLPGLFSNSVIDSGLIFLLLEYSVIAFATGCSDLLSSEDKVDKNSASDTSLKKIFFTDNFLQ